MNSQFYYSKSEICLICSLICWRFGCVHFFHWNFVGHWEKSSRLTYYLSWRVCIIVGHACMLTFVLVFHVLLVCESSHMKIKLCISQWFAHAITWWPVFRWFHAPTLIAACLQIRTFPENLGVIMGLPRDLVSLISVFNAQKQSIKNWNEQSSQ